LRARFLFYSFPAHNLASIAHQNPQFSSKTEDVEAKIRMSTYGLVTLDEMKKAQQMAEEERARRIAEASEDGTVKKKDKKKKKKKPTATLSFDMEEEEEEEPNNGESLGADAERAKWVTFVWEAAGFGLMSVYPGEALLVVLCAMSNSRLTSGRTNSAHFVRRADIRIDVVHTTL
jgi:hypothetical protein